MIGSLDVSAVGLGCNQFGTRLDAAGTKAVVDAALDAGVTFFDTADVYGAGKSEEYLGAALDGGRDNVVIATKFGWHAGETVPGGASARYVKDAAEASLRRLRTDRIDLYQLHVPVPETPLDETLGALGELVAEGKVCAFGVSNFTLEQLRETQGAPVASLQNRYSLLYREAEQNVLPECERREIAFIPYAPLEGGLLTGKYQRHAPAPPGSRLAGQVVDDTLSAAVERLAAFAARRGRSLLELAVSWLVAQSAVASVIAGATSPEQVRANVAAADWELSPDELRQVDEEVLGR